jgi:hypothetical protein
VTTDGEEVALDLFQERVERRAWQQRPRDAHRGVELVDVAIGGHAGIVLGHSSATEETGVSFVAGSCVDLHGVTIIGLSPHRHHQ